MTDTNAEAFVIAEVLTSSDYLAAAAALSDAAEEGAYHDKVKQLARANRFRNVGLQVRQQELEVHGLGAASNAEIVKSVIMTDPNGFDMNRWNCGTVACIGGWCERIAQATTPGISFGTMDAGRFLGIPNYDVADALFYPPEHLDWRCITPSIACTAIDVAREPGATWEGVHEFWKANVPRKAG